MRQVCHALFGAVALFLAAHHAQAQDSGAVVPQAQRADGAPISRVEAVVTRSGGNTARDGALALRLRASLAHLVGRNFSRPLIERALAAERGRIGPAKIDYDLLPGTEPGTITLRVELDTAGEREGVPPGPTGVFAGQPRQFPTLYRSDRVLVTGILNGGFGAYTDGNPWFGATQAFTLGSPIAGKRPGSQPAWTEGFVEYGIAGATQLGDSPLYIYGNITAITSWSRGQDIYRADNRTFSGIEKAYAGLYYTDPVSGGTLNISAGRQNVTLNDGFLVHFVRGSANIGKHGGTYVGPRNANSFSLVGEGSLGPWALKAFYIDPDELRIVDSRSTFAGVNLRYNITPTLSVDGSYIAVVNSDTVFRTPGGARVPRDGVRTVSSHVRWNTALGVEGLWFASEFAHQTNAFSPMSAYSGYGLVGYQATWLPWSPSLSYRYAHASGDKPGTARYERFDPLLSTGLGNWLQGINFGKVTSNSNLAVHRLQFNLAPSPALNITFDWHLLRAVESNNLGSNPVLAQLSSRDLGQEFTASVRWAINRNLYLQSLVSVGAPGRALRDAGATKNWTTTQASLYWTF